MISEPWVVKEAVKQVLEVPLRERLLFGTAAFPFAVATEDQKEGMLRLP